MPLWGGRAARRWHRPGSDVQGAGAGRRRGGRGEAEQPEGDHHGGTVSVCRAGLIPTGAGFVLEALHAPSLFWVRRPPPCCGQLEWGHDPPCPRRGLGHTRHVGWRTGGLMYFSPHISPIQKKLDGSSPHGATLSGSPLLPGEYPAPVRPRRGGGVPPRVRVPEATGRRGRGSGFVAQSFPASTSLTSLSALTSVRLSTWLAASFSILPPFTRSSCHFFSLHPHLFYVDEGFD